MRHRPSAAAQRLAETLSRCPSSAEFCFVGPDTGEDKRLEQDEQSGVHPFNPLDEPPRRSVQRRDRPQDDRREWADRFEPSSRSGRRRDASPHDRLQPNALVVQQPRNHRYLGPSAVPLNRTCPPTDWPRSGHLGDSQPSPPAVVPCGPDRCEVAFWPLRSP
jgi:hypothetical protein